MRKMLLAIVALGALAWSGTASALVQTTDVAFENKGMPTGSGSVSLDFKTPATSSAPKRVIVHVTVRIRKTGHATVRTDTMQVQKGSGMTVDVVVTTDDGHTFTVTDVPVETFYGGVIEVGGGGGGPGMPLFGGFTPMPAPGGPSGLYISSRTSVYNSNATFLERRAATGASTNTFSVFNTDGRFGFGGGWDGLPTIAGVPWSPFVSYDILNQDLTQGFSGGSCICETIKSVLSAGVQLPIIVNGDSKVYLLGGATWVEKEFTVNFVPLSTTVTTTLLGPTFGAGVSGTVPFYNRLTWYFQYQHAWLPDYTLVMPASSPTFNYTFQNGWDSFTGGVTFHFWDPLGSMR